MFGLVFMKFRKLKNFHGKSLIFCHIQSFCHAKQILAIKGVEIGVLRESVKKKNRDENFFQKTLNEVLKCCKKRYLLILKLMQNMK